MVLLFKSEAMPETWVDALQALEPGLEVRVWPDWGAPEAADFALVWKPPKGELAKYPNLKAIFSIGAGIDHLASDPELPRHIPLVRMVDPSLTAGMTEYVVMNVLHHHRYMLDYGAQQRAGRWHLLDQIPPWRRRVGVRDRAVGAPASRARRAFRGARGMRPGRSGCRSQSPDAPLTLYADRSDPDSRSAVRRDSPRRS